MIYSVDRIEGNFAVCEDENRSMRRFSLTDLYPDVKEGDLFIQEDGACRFLPDETARVKEKNRDLLNKLRAQAD